MKNWVRNNKGFLVFMLLFGVFRTAIADWNPIPSGSMRPSLVEGDVVFVNRLAFDLKVPLTDVIVARLGEPRRGDVVTFSSPTNGKRLIKRIIALPGDVIEMRDEKVTINGRVAAYTPLDSVMEILPDGSSLNAMRADEHLDGATHRIQVMPELFARRNFGPIKVPADQFLMLGDNRDLSEDSRYIGLVPRALLIGRAERVLVSADIKGNWMLRGERFGMQMQ